MVLMALVAKPKAHSVASQSSSALYDTSIVTYKIHTSTIFEHIEEEKTVHSEARANNDNSDAAEISSRTIVDLLSQMKDSFEVLLLVCIIEESNCVYLFISNTESAKILFVNLIAST